MRDAQLTWEYENESWNAKLPNGDFFHVVKTGGEWTAYQVFVNQPDPIIASYCKRDHERWVLDLGTTGLLSDASIKCVEMYRANLLDAAKVAK